MKQSPWGRLAGVSAGVMGIATAALGSGGHFRRLPRYARNDPKKQVASQ